MAYYGYGPFSLCVIHKEGLYPSSGNINRLMMMNQLFCCKDYKKDSFPMTSTLQNINTNTNNKKINE
jgi:hypothetical protein